MWPFKRRGGSGFSWSSTAEEVTLGIDATALTAIVTDIFIEAVVFVERRTGASSGIGAETARVLALRGVHVIMGVIDMMDAFNVKDSILKQIPTAKVDVMKLDLSSMASVHHFADEFNSTSLPLNILMSFSSNKSVVGKYEESSKRNYSNWRAYGQSKLANILHANELARRFKEDGVDITANSLHPGFITNTNIHLQNRFLTGLVNILSSFVPRYIERFVLKNVEQGASTTCYLALHPVSGINGKYFADNNVSETCLQGRDMDLAKMLWDFSMNLTMKNEQ
ncbi:hypothetical protein V8G54_011684 [Vigna mungo]|uniref:Short-chain dehydrogenase TIC 32, chloroplastic n=1 Tax=Vigna mungo TaxID=3915 RepID=A0AAQ3S2K0_VIGMU